MGNAAATDLCPGARVLDVGCGTGGAPLPLARHATARRTALAPLPPWYGYVFFVLRWRGTRGVTRVYDAR